MAGPEKNPMFEDGKVSGTYGVEKKGKTPGEKNPAEGCVLDAFGRVCETWVPVELSSVVERELPPARGHS